MDGVHHCLRIREPLPVKLVASPGVLLPMEPVYYNVVKRNLPAPVLGHCGKHLFLGIVFLTALPETHCPLRHYRSLARKSTAAVNDLIRIVTCNEIIVNFLLHLTPPAHFRPGLRCNRSECPERAVGHIPVRLPLNPQRAAPALDELVTEFITIWIPSSSPTFRHNLHGIYPHPDITRIIENEIEVPILIALKHSIVCHYSALERDLSLQPLDVAEVISLEMVKAYIFLIPYKSTAVSGSVSTCKSAGNAIHIIEGECLGQREAGCRIAEAAI